MGLSTRQIAEKLGLPGLTRWVRVRLLKRTSRVAFDKDADCWRIYVYEPERAPKGGVKIMWWPLSWLVFDTKQVAEDHLELHGDYSP